MKAIKHTVTITIEALSMECIPSLVHRVAEQIKDEFHNGHTIASDGDSVQWNVETKGVIF